MPLLTNDDWRAKLARCLDTAAAEENIRLVAFVFMPEHVHLLIDPTDPEPDIGRFLARLKQPFSAQIKESLSAQGARLLKRLTVRERPGKICFRYWQEGPGYDRNISTTPAVLAAIEYIHQNPIRRGLCQRAIDWKWSSARYYLADPPKQQAPDLPTIHGLRPGTLT